MVIIEHPGVVAIVAFNTTDVDLARHAAARGLARRLRVNLFRDIPGPGEKAGRQVEACILQNLSVRHMTGHSAHKDPLSAIDDAISALRRSLRGA